MIRFLLGWAAAALTAAALTSVVEAQVTLARLPAIAGPITLADSMRQTVNTLIGFGPLFGAILAGALLVLLLLAALIGRFAAGLRGSVFLAAGAAAPLAVSFGLKSAMGVAVVQAAETPAGVLGLGVAGAVAGLVAALISAPRLKAQAPAATSAHPA